MSSALSKELRQKHNVRSIPIRKDDEVQVIYIYTFSNVLGGGGLWRDRVLKLKYCQILFREQLDVLV